MSNQTVTALSVHQHRYLALKIRRDYRFAEHQQFARLCGAELTAACQSFPIGFIPDAGAWTPVAILGLREQQNLFVTRAGQWSAEYIPAVFRVHPFTLAHHPEQNAPLLCFDPQDPNLVSASVLGGDHRPLFDEHGQPSAFTRDLIDFFQQVAADTETTRAALTDLAQHQLLIPWPVRVDDPQRQVPIHLEGLFQIDEARLRALPTEVFLDLRERGLLDLIYAHGFSKRLVARLERLLRLRKADEPGGQELRFDDVFSSAEDEILFKFD